MDLAHWKVLIVEDEVDAQDILIPILEHHRVSVSTAFTAEEALEQLESQQPTVAIVDLALPGMDGWQFLRALQANPVLAGIPAVAMTAYNSSSVAQEALEAGFSAYFPKPINGRTFVEDLVNILQTA